MTTYPQQHEPWDPSYPPVWLLPAQDDEEGVKLLDMPSKPFNKCLQQKNIIAFNTTLNIIDRAMAS